MTGPMVLDGILLKVLLLNTVLHKLTSHTSTMSTLLILIISRQVSTSLKLVKIKTHQIMNMEATMIFSEKIAQEKAGYQDT